MMSSRRLFSPPWMNSAVTIHPQSIHSNISLDITVHHLILPARCTRSDLRHHYTVMPAVPAHTQANM